MVNKICPASAEEGQRAHQEMLRSFLAGARGVVLVKNIFLANTTPPAPNKVAARFFLIAQSALLG